ncbi:MAG: hypothetical protein ACRCS5_06015 [Sphingomonas sp.]
METGFRNARVRTAQALPLGWRHLTEVDIEQVIAIVVERSSSGADLVTLEACLLLWCGLVTGRHPTDLLAMTIRKVAKGSRLGNQPQGLIERSGKWGWWLRAAAPQDQKSVRKQMNPTSPFVYLPATEMVAMLAEICVEKRNSTSAGRFHISGEPQPLFATGKRAIGEMSRMLAARNPAGIDRARRATTTPEAVARWLPAELLGAPGGDIVPASVITGQLPSVARTAAHYGAVSHGGVIRRYEAAIRRVDALSHDDIPSDALVSHLGDKFTPTDTAVRHLIAQLTDGLANAEHDAADRHLAMMRYTVALLTFAFAHRGDSGSIPSLWAVHAETGLCWVADKTIAGSQSRRMVWVCATAARQLQLYDEHLGELQAGVSRAAAQIIADTRSGRSLPLFELTPEGGVRKLNTSVASSEALKRWGLPKNAGRHWLRAKLVGRCSTESLHAFYGHGPVSDGSWDEMSALDPSAYRADLARVLDTVLAEIGWTARSPAKTGAAA